MNEWFGKGFYRKGNVVKRFGPSKNRQTLKIEKSMFSSPSRKSSLTLWGPNDYITCAKPLVSF